MPAGAAADGSPAALARLLPLPPGLFAVTINDTAATEPGGDGLALPAVQLCAVPDGKEAVEIRDGSGRERGWLGPRDMLFVRSPACGGALLATVYFAAGAGERLPSLRVRSIAPPGPEATVTLATAEPATVPAEPTPVSLEVIAHISGRGETRFLDAEWIGQGDPTAAPSSGDAAIESFVLAPHEPGAAAAIEYKGLMASGAETPWLAAGMPCGDPGGGVALLGFAVRHKPTGVTGLLLDCEYSGRFRSGAVAGPARNGAPCRSPAAADPLVGLQLHIRARRPRPT
jgi:hypothetical protein